MNKTDEWLKQRQIQAEMKRLSDGMKAQNAVWDATMQPLFLEHSRTLNQQIEENERLWDRLRVAQIVAWLAVGLFVLSMLLWIFAR